MMKAFPTSTHKGMMRGKCLAQKQQDSGEGVDDWWDFPPLDGSVREMTKLSNKCLKIAKIVETTNLWP